MTGANGFRLDRTQLSIRSLADGDDSAEYWRSRPPDERLAALEFLREQMYPGYDSATTRLQRVLEVVKRTEG